MFITSTTSQREIHRSRNRPLFTTTQKFVILHARKWINLRQIQISAHKRAFQNRTFTTEWKSESLTTGALLNPTLVDERHSS